MSTIETKDAAAAGPLCVNCIHGKRSVTEFVCTAPNITKVISLVSGRQLGPTCFAARQEDGECSPAGALFEQATVAGNRIPYGKLLAPHANTKASATELNNLRFLQRKCLAAIEDIEDATRTYGVDSKESAEVTERYKQQLDGNFVQILGEAVKSLHRDLD